MNLALSQLTRSLQSRIVPLLDLSDLPEAKRADPEASEKLTRALAAAAVISIALADDVKAAQSVTDAPYRTFSGQVVLGVLLGAFLALIVYVQRLSRFTRPARFLSLKGMR